MSKKSNKSLTQRAQTLQKTLEELGSPVPHCTVLEALARLDGHRTLHVAQAAKPVPSDSVALQTLAIRLASRVFFQSTGSWEGKELQLLAQVQAVFAAEAEKGGAHVEAHLAQLLDAGRGVKVNSAFEMLQVNEWKAAFEALVAANAQELGAFVQAPAQLRKSTTLFAGLARDWRVADKELDPTHPQARPWNTTIEQAPSGDQFHVEFLRDTPSGAPGDEPEAAGPGVFLEIANGVPVVRLYPDSQGDCLLSVHLTADGLYLCPGYSNSRWHNGPPSPEHTGLHAVYQEEAFIESPGSDSPAGNKPEHRVALDTNNHRYLLAE